MKALSIVGLIFAIISIFIPIFGILIAMLCSLLALITFVKQPTISGAIFGINIFSTAFLSPVLASVAANSGIDTYLFFVKYHVVLMFIAFILYFIFRKKNSVA